MRRNVTAMGITLRPPGVDRRIGAPPDAVWRLLIDIDQWPLWGPSVRRAELHGGSTELTPGAHGTVWTSLGPTLPFRITEFEPGRRWGWTVAGVPATVHEVRSVPGGCLVRFETPWWAGAYLPVCAAALVRIDRLARQPQ